MGEHEVNIVKPFEVDQSVVKIVTINQIYMVLGWVSLFSVPAYLFFIFRLVAKLESKESDYWRSIGNPSATDFKDQPLILKIILLPGRLPARIKNLYSVEILIVRLLFLLSTTLLLALYFIGMVIRPF